MSEGRGGKKKRKKEKKTTQKYKAHVCTVKFKVST